MRCGMMVASQERTAASRGVGLEMEGVCRCSWIAGYGLGLQGGEFVVVSCLAQCWLRLMWLVWIVVWQSYVGCWLRLEIVCVSVLREWQTVAGKWQVSGRSWCMFHAGFALV